MAHQPYHLARRVFPISHDLRGTRHRSLHKEHKSYIKEEQQQKIKLDKLIADNVNNEEDWDIRNAVRRRIHSTAYLL